MESPGREYLLLKSYVRRALNFRREYPKWFSWGDATAFYLSWRRTMNAEGHCLEHELPWLTFPAIERLRSFLAPDMRVFEYGSGGSTLFFARRANEVVSMEHNGEWYEKLMSRLEEEKVTNCTIHHVPPSPDDRGESGDPADPDAYVSSSEQHEGMSFYEYATKIEAYPDDYFDVVLVDGRARPSCFKNAIPKVKQNGMLVWDNTSRSRYHRAMKLAPDEFQFVDCPGPVPFLHTFMKTAIWQGPGH